jgi:hypothetical protein
MLRTDVIESIFEGIQQSSSFGAPGQFLDSIGIDPDMPATDDASDVKPSGIVRPVNYEKFSGAEVTSAPIAIITNPKDEYTYVVLAEGKIIRYDSDDTYDNTFGVLHVQESASNVEARGADYYNNYIYVRTPHDVSRLGPLNGTPSLTDSWWTSTAGQTALTDTDYPETLFDIGYLNHFGTLHVDNKLYFLDFINGVGMAHFIKTTKVTVEGDTNDGSEYGALDLPLNYYPITISPAGNDIAVTATPTSSTNVLQGKAKMFLWNTIDDSFYRAVPLPNTICSVLKYDNGTLYGIAGDLAGGYQLFRYVGGDSVEPLETVNEGYPPLQGAADYVGNRLIWGANRTTPMVCSGLFAHGSKSDLFPRALHHIALLAFV